MFFLKFFFGRKSTLPTKQYGKGCGRVLKGFMNYDLLFIIFDFLMKERILAGRKFRTGQRIQTNKIPAEGG